MLKRLVVLLVFSCSICFGGLASAGNFADLGNFTLNLPPDRGITRDFHTSLGKMTLMFRKNSKNEPKYRFHMVAYLDGRAFCDLYWPEGIYHLRVIDDRENQRIIFGMLTDNEIQVVGYGKAEGKLRGIPDTYTYKIPRKGAMGAKGPKLLLDDENNLQLLFSEPDGEYGTRYKLEWNKGLNRFNYHDITLRPEPPTTGTDSEQGDDSPEPVPTGGVEAPEESF